MDGFHILFDIEPQIRRASGKHYHLNLGYHEFDSMESELKSMINAQEEGRFIYENAMLLILLCRICAKISGDDTFPEEKSDLLSVMEYIKNNLDQKLTLSFLSRFANMSTATLNRRFRETVGISPMAYVMKKRIAKARELIDEGGKSRAEIAQQCGFYDISHMNKYL